jgi:hypothetical protein
MLHFLAKSKVERSRMINEGCVWLCLAATSLENVLLLALISAALSTSLSANFNVVYLSAYLGTGAGYSGLDSMSSDVNSNNSEFPVRSNNKLVLFCLYF